MPLVSDLVASESVDFPEGVRSFLPHRFYVPLTQEDGRVCTCTVKDGEHVTEGQEIAACLSDPLAAHIHSPVPGIFEKQEVYPLPDGKRGPAAVIKMQGSFSFLGKMKEAADWHSYSPASLCRRFAEMGIVNTFWKPVSLASEIERVSNKATRILVVRLFDDDPSRMTESFIAAQYTRKVLEGVAIIAYAMEATGIVFVYDSRRGEVDQPMISSVFSQMPVMQVPVKAEKYPSGFRSELLTAVKKAAQERGADFITSLLTHRDVFIDTLTAVAVQEAVTLNKPAVEHFVHVTGNCLRSAGMLNVRLGTTVADLAEGCGGFKIPPVKIIINGLITGCAVSSEDIPVTKNVKSVTFMSAAELPDQRFTTCVRCGKCRSVCPSGLYPDILYRHVSGGKAAGRDFLEMALLCSECCLCNSVCPSRLPLSQSIALLKDGR